MTAYQPRSSVVPDGMHPGDFLETVLMPHWVATGAAGSVRSFLVALWSFHPSGSTFTPMRRIAARMGSSARTAERAQTWAVEYGLLRVTLEEHRKVTRTVRTIVLPVGNPVDNYPDVSSGSPLGGDPDPDVSSGLTPTCRRSDPDVSSGPSEGKEYSYEVTHAAVVSCPQDEAHTPFMDALVTRGEYLALRPAVKGACRDYLRRVLEDDPVWCAVEGPQVVADKVLAEFGG